MSKSEISKRIRDDSRVILADFITVLEAVHILSPIFGGDDAAKDVVISRIRDGSLEGFAHYLLQEADMGRPPFDDLIWGAYKPVAHAHQNDRPYVRFASELGHPAIVPADFMASSDGWKIDESFTSWADGRFLCRRPAIFTLPHASLAGADKMTRRIVGSLSFRRQDIQKIKDHKAKSAGGRPHKDEAWVAFWHSLIQLAQDQRLTASQFRTREELLDEVLHLTGGSLSKNSIRHLVVQVWEKFAAGSSSG